MHGSHIANESACIDHNPFLTLSTQHNQLIINDGVTVPYNRTLFCTMHRHGNFQTIPYSRAFLITEFLISVHFHTLKHRHKFGTQGSVPYNRAFLISVFLISVSDCTMTLSEKHSITALFSYQRFSCTFSCTSNRKRNQINIMTILSTLI